MTKVVTWGVAVTAAGIDGGGIRAASLIGTGVMLVSAFAHCAVERWQIRRENGAIARLRREIE